MTLTQQILADLLISRSTASSIAGRLAVSDQVITPILIHEEKQGTVEAKPLSDLFADLSVWQLTEQGREIASALPVSAPVFPEN